jgi:hypothetical protein
LKVSKLALERCDSLVSGRGGGRGFRGREEGVLLLERGSEGGELEVQGRDGLLRLGQVLSVSLEDEWMERKRQARHEQGRARESRRHEQDGRLHRSPVRSIVKLPISLEWSTLRLVSIVSRLARSASVSLLCASLQFSQ